jgi:hypothetical protein
MYPQYNNNMIIKKYISLEPRSSRPVWAHSESLSQKKKKEGGADPFGYSPVD